MRLSTSSSSQRKACGVLVAAMLAAARLGMPYSPVASPKDVMGGLFRPLTPPPGARTVAILGDSVFSSAFTDTPQQQIEAQLQRHLGSGWYCSNQSLYGSTFEDLRLRVLTWRVRPSVVVVDIEALKFVRRKDAAVVASNFQDSLERYLNWRNVLGPAGQANGNSLSSLWMLARGSLKNAFLLDPRQTAWFLDKLGRVKGVGSLAQAVNPFSESATQPTDSWTGNHRWDDPTGIARWKNELSDLNKMVLVTGPTQAIDPGSWTQFMKLVDTVQASGCRLLLIQTPYCAPLKRLIRPDVSAQIDVSTAAFARNARRLGLDVLDLRGALPPDAFRDLLHPNAKGDALIAQLTASALRDRFGANSGGPPWASKASVGQTPPQANLDRS